jgi:hypothetical protein
LEVKNKNTIVSNRFSGDLKEYYKKLEGKNLIFGIGIRKYNEKKWIGGNAGYKVFIIQYGILGVLIVFLFYFTIVFVHKSHLVFFFMMVYFLCFMQAAYPLWIGLLMIFISAIPNLNSNKVNFIDEKQKTN